jgi:nickel-type superoxide dismutase maturation protease
VNLSASRAGISVTAALGAAAGVVGAALWLARPRRVVVEGTSMSPTLTGGDRLLVVRRAGLRIGDIVALADPRSPDRVLVKRVVSVTGSAVEVVGDNSRSSTDSRAFGPVDRRAVMGRVVYRYGPPGRTGPVW